MPGVMGLGYISAFSERLAMSVIVSHGVPALASKLQNEGEDHIRAGGALLVSHGIHVVL